MKKLIIFGTLNVVFAIILFWAFYSALKSDIEKVNLRNSQTDSKSFPIAENEVKTIIFYTDRESDTYLFSDGDYHDFAVRGLIETFNAWSKNEPYETWWRGCRSLRKRWTECHLSPEGEVPKCHNCQILSTQILSPEIRGRNVYSLIVFYK
jgi:hypothetical protein